jgi:hypothetical protein
LNLRPDLEIYDEDDTTVGPKFLREFEVEKRARLAAAGKHSESQSGAQVAEEEEEEEEKGLFEESEDEGTSSQLGQSQSQVADDAQEQQEWKGFADNKAPSAKPDQSGSTNWKDHEIEEDQTIDLVEKDNTTDNPNQRLETVPGHEVTIDKKTEDPSLDQVSGA